jgi:subtilisin-like proprotein convertase family protein
VNGFTCTALTGVTATLSTSTPGVSVTQASGNYGSVAAGATVSGNTYQIFVAASACITTVDLTLSLTSAQGITSTRAIRLTVYGGPSVTATYSGPSVAIPDNNPAGATTSVVVPGSVVVGDINLKLTTITHPWVGDLVVTLTAPDATVITMVNRLPHGEGSNDSDNFSNTILDDAAATSIQSQSVSVANATFKPANPLSGFNGKVGNGTWTLKVADGGPSDTGTVVGWSITIAPAPTGCPDPPARDFNADGKADIPWRNTSGHVSLWLMNGPSVVSSATVATGVASAWAIANTGDFNSDGKADILWRHSSGDIALWFMNGAAVTGTATLGNVPIDWTIRDVGDFNGDGKTDILWRHTSGTLSLWLMNGAIVASSAILGNVGNDWSIVDVADFNNDGKADILWRHTSGSVTLWLMSGTTITSSVAVGTVGNDWSIAAVADFDGDGKADILWRRTSGTLAIWLMNGGAVASSAIVSTVTADWAILRVLDYNGDGRADILWRNTTSTATAMWLMNGVTVTSTASLGAVPLVWTPQ